MARDIPVDPAPTAVAERLRQRLEGLDGLVTNDGHHYPLRVQIEDTDLGGIVYHANYLNFAERARSAFLRCLDIHQEQAMQAMQAMAPNGPDSRNSKASGDAGMLFVVRRTEIDFISPAGLGQVLNVITRPVRLGGASMSLHQTVTNFENGHILARLVVDIGCVTAGTGGDMRPRRMPSAVVDRLRSAMLPDQDPE